MIRADTFWELVERRAAETPEAFFGLDEAGRERTFREYRDDSLRLAAGLSTRGVGPGTAVSCRPRVPPGPPRRASGRPRGRHLK